MTPYIKIGQIINTHGCRGELKVFPLTDDINRFHELKHVYVRNGSAYHEYGVAGARVYKGLILIYLDGINTMNDAERLKGRYLELPVSELKKLPEGQYYIFQLIGFNVLDEGKHIGKIIDILKTGSNDVYVVKKAGSKKEVLIPALKSVVKKICMKSGTVEIKMPPGLDD